MKKILLLLNLIFYSLLFCQTLDLPNSVLSPNSSSLGKYGDLPMSLYSGKANVDIPLYSLNEGGLQLNVNLNYDTGGVRVSDVPSWVGQNWTLNAGGTIVRTIKGKTFDEQIFDWSGYPTTQKGYYYNYSKLAGANWNSETYLSDLAKNAGTSIDYMHDLEPDIFTFNFFGISGKFFIGEDGNWKVSSSSNIKVIVNMQDNIVPMNFPNIGGGAHNQNKFPKVISKIQLLDDQGNRFVFGGSSNAIEYSNYDFFNQSNTLFFSSAWHLTEVYNKFNKKVYSLEYERDGYQAIFFNVNRYINFTKPSNGSMWKPGGGCSTSSNDSGVYVSGQLIIPSYLKKITGLRSNTVLNFNSYSRNSLTYNNNDASIYLTYTKWLDDHDDYQEGIPLSEWIEHSFYYLRHQLDGVTVENIGSIAPMDAGWFLQRLRWRKLSSIQISSQNVNRNVLFGYTDNSSERLKLDKVSIDKTYNYSFEYNNFSGLPNFLSTSIDHFGFYKGTAFNMDPNLHYNSREIDNNYLQYGTLTKIVYPTGGFTTFEYEPNDYSKTVNENSQLYNKSGFISGLRIKKMIDFSDSINKVEKNYIYKNALNSSESSGTLLQNIQYYYPNWTVKTTAGKIYTASSFSINTLIPLSNFSGAYIGYSTVIEKTTDNGYIINRFYDYADSPNVKYSGTIAVNHSIFDPKTEKGYKRGEIKLKEYYNNSNIKVKEEQFNYNEISPRKVRAYSYDNYLPCSWVMDGVLTGNAYEIYYSDFLNTVKTTREYGENGQLLTATETKNYIEKENFGDVFLRNKYQLTSESKLLKEEYQYTFDKASAEPYTSLANRREFAVIENNKILDAENISKIQLEYSTLNIYNKYGQQTTSTEIFPFKITESKGEDGAEEKLVIDRYDIDGNILLAHKPNGSYVYYFYGYNNRFPIMKVEGALSPGSGYTFEYYATQLRDLVEATSPNISQIINKQNNIINYFPNHKIEFYTHKPNIGVISITRENGVVEFYNYDFLGRLIDIKDQNGKILKDFYYQLKN